MSSSLMKEKKNLMLPPVLSASNVPPNYREVEFWRISASWRRIIFANLLGLMLLPLCGFIFLFLLAVAFGGNLDSSVFICNVPLVFLVFFTMIFFHEGVHALAVMAFGGKPTFGINWKVGAVYTTVKGLAFRRWVFLVLLLSPLVVLSGLYLLTARFLQSGFWISFAYLSMVLNGACSVGDLYAARHLLRYPSEAYVVDEEDGMRIFLPVD